MVSGGLIGAVRLLEPFLISDTCWAESCRSQGPPCCSHTLLIVFCQNGCASQLPHPVTPMRPSLFSQDVGDTTPTRHTRGHTQQRGREKPSPGSDPDVFRLWLQWGQWAKADRGGNRTKSGQRSLHQWHCCGAGVRHGGFGAHGGGTFARKQVAWLVTGTDSWQVQQRLTAECGWQRGEEERSPAEAVLSEMLLSDSHSGTQWFYFGVCVCVYASPHQKKCWTSQLFLHQSQLCFHGKSENPNLVPEQPPLVPLIKDAEHLETRAVVARWTWPHCAQPWRQQIDVGTLKAPESMLTGGWVMGRCGGLFSARSTRCWGTQHSWRDFRPFICLITSFFTSPRKLAPTSSPARKKRSL